VQLIKMALKRGQFYLCAEILRFLVPPREGVVQWGPCSPPSSSAGVSKDAAAAAAAGAAAQSGPQKQPSGSAAAAAGQTGWFSWIWGGSGGSQAQQQQQQATDKAGKMLAGSGAGAANGIAAGYPGEGGLLSQGSLTTSANLEHGSDACKIVADKAWRLLLQVRIVLFPSADPASLLLWRPVAITCCATCGFVTLPLLTGSQGTLFFETQGDCNPDRLGPHTVEPSHLNWRARKLYNSLYCLVLY
jgi:hypothetical protein